MGKMTNLHRQIRWETASNGGNGNYHSGPKGLGCREDDPTLKCNPDVSITRQLQHYAGLNGYSKLAELVDVIEQMRVKRKAEEERRIRDAEWEYILQL